MLEAIAFGKPVVTHLWLESMGQVKLYMDEEAFLLRDSRKEKEFGFSMPASLARSRKNPLLQVNVPISVGYYSVLLAFSFCFHFYHILNSSFCRVGEF